MRPDFVQSYWQQDDNLFDFGEFANWRGSFSDAARGAGQNETGRDFGADVSAWATRSSDSEVGSDVDEIEGGYAPSWKETGGGNPGDTDSGSTDGTGGSHVGS